MTWVMLGMMGGGGDEGIRTLDLCSAIAALSQLSYIPNKRREYTGRRERGRGVGAVEWHQQLPALIRYKV
jgi:hypothetical protein